LTVATNGVINWMPTEAQGPGSYTVTISVTDTNPVAVNATSLSTTNSFQITVNEVNTAPSLTLPPNTNIVEQVAWSATATATDSDIPANPLNFKLVNGPSGLTVTTNGVINWTPTEAQGPGVYTVTISVTDTNPAAVNAKSLSTTNSFQITVNEVNTAPSLTLPPSTNINEQVAWSATATASDSDIPANPLTFALVNGPTGLTVATNGVINWTPTEAQGPGVYTVAISVTDTNPAAVNAKSLSTTNSFQITVNEVNTAPVLGVVGNQVVNELTMLIVTNQATDSDIPANVLTYQLINPPAGATIDTNGVITWTPTEAQGPGTNTITTVVTDFNPWAVNAQHLSATNSFTVVVNEVNTAPVLPAQFNRTIHGKLLMIVTNTATDSDIPANSLTYTLLTKPSGATIDTNGVISWTPVVSQVPSTNTITTVVTDYNPWAVNAQHLSATNSFTVVVTTTTVNSPPWLPMQTNQVVNEQTTLVVTNTGMDSNIPANALSYALLAAPAGAAIDSNGIITWTPTQTQSPGTNTITTVVTDNGSPPMSATNSFTVIVKEVNVAPVLPVVSTQTVSALTLLTVIDTATEPNIHATTIGYRLVNPPAGMTINVNGIITWTPTQAQSPSTNIITTVVTNSDAFDLVNPQLTASNSFTVIVPGGSTLPLIQSISLTNSIATIKWSAVSGQNYRLQYKQNLTDSTWSNVVPDFTASGSIAIGTNGVNNSTQQFYRVMLLQ
jgi:hypothetical protein